MWVNSYSKPQMKSATVMPSTHSADKLLPRQNVRRRKAFGLISTLSTSRGLPITHPFTGVNGAGKTIKSPESAKISF